MVTDNGCSFCRQKSYLCPEDMCPACGARIIPDTDIGNSAGLSATATSTWRTPPLAQEAVLVSDADMIRLFGEQDTCTPIVGIRTLTTGEAQALYRGERNPSPW